MNIETGASSGDPRKRNVVRLEPAERRWPFPWWATAIVVGWGGLVAGGLALARATGNEEPTCMFRRVTGIPCGTCGSTRCVLAAGRGDVAEAFLHNPFMFTLLAGMAVVLGLRLVGGRAVVVDFGPRGRWWMWSAIALLFLLNWAWVIWRHVG